MKVLITLPRKDFDPSEVVIPWSILRTGCQIVFATPDGVRSVPDRHTLTGEGLGILTPVLRADKRIQHALKEMMDTHYFHHPITYEEALNSEFDGIILPGGHAGGIKEYLDSEILQKIISNHMEKRRPIGAICQAVLLLARSKGSKSVSVIHNKKVTALPKIAEKITNKLINKSFVKDFKSPIKSSIEDEVKSVLENEKQQFSPGPPLLVKDSLSRLWAGHVVRDENLVTARWAGDAHRFAMEFKEMLL